MAKGERLALNIRVFKYLTLWPADNDNKYVTIIKDFTFYLIVLPLYIGAVYELVRECQGYLDPAGRRLTNALHIHCLNLLLLFAFLFQSRRDKMKEVINKLHELEEHFESPETEEMEKFNKLLTYLYNGYILTSGIAYIFLPFMSFKSCEEKRRYSEYAKDLPCGFMFIFRLPFDYRKSPMYEFVFLHMTAITYLFSWVIVSCLQFISCIILHTVGHLRTFKRILKQAVSEKDKKLMDKCIEYHNDIIRYWNYANNCFAPFSFSLLCFASTMIGTLEYEIILEKNNGTFFELIRYFAHLFAWFVLVFALCTAAQMLWNESVDTALELFQTDWLDCPLHMQKTVLFMMMRSQRPLTVNTGPIGELNYSTFIMILRSGYTFLAVLTNLK